MKITAAQLEEGYKIKREFTRVLNEVFTNTHQWYSGEKKKIKDTYGKKGDHRGDSEQRKLRAEFVGKMEKLNKYLKELQRLTPEKAYSRKEEFEGLIARRFEGDIRFKHRYADLAGIVSVILFFFVLSLAVFKGHSQESAGTIFALMVVGFFLIAIFLWWTRNKRMLAPAYT
ncbi:hypothetical protein JXB27_04810 [Candidatus Woesearchaeota archaeon]|nr:hypothetical protein [Candidatus Woesearchaeota archaeon]